MVDKNSRIINTNEAIGQLAAEYKYVQQMIVELEDIENEKDLEGKEKHLQKVNKISKFLSRTERKEFREAKKKIIGKFRKFVKNLPSTEEKLIKQALEKLGKLEVIEKKLVASFSRWGGDVKEEIKDLEKHIHKNMKNIELQSQEEINAEIKKFEKELEELTTWIAGADQLLKDLGKLDKEILAHLDKTFSQLLVEQKFDLLISLAKQMKYFPDTVTALLYNWFQPSPGRDHRNLDRLNKLIEVFEICGVKNKYPIPKGEAKHILDRAFEMVTDLEMSVKTFKNWKKTIMRCDNGEKGWEYWRVLSLKVPYKVSIGPFDDVEHPLPEMVKKLRELGNKEPKIVKEMRGICGLDEDFLLIK
tara:strand:- start:139 stop:1218 length:1080 start_codon:yes stop_codon:yes gene_type:complete